MGVRERARRRHRRRLQPVRGQAPQGRGLQAARREPGRRAEVLRLEIQLLAGAAARRSAGRRDSVRWDSVRWDSVRWDSVRRARAVAVAEPQGNVPSSGWGQVNRGEKMFLRICGAAALLLVIPFSAHAAITCADVLRAIDKDLAGVVTCFVSNDLTTTNTAIDQKTTPDNNSLGLAPGAFTPITDRGVISPDAPNRMPIMKAVPGLQINARIASDPTGQARFLLRLPNDWNGRLVVAGASGTRSEFNGDFAWSDYVLQQGYAYASQNKGVLNLSIVTLVPPPPADPLACRLNPASPVFVHFFDNDPGQPFTRWAEFMIKAAELARDGVKAGYGRSPRFTYAVGTSNGGYQVRRAVELAREFFDGGVDWEGTFVDEHAPNLLTDLPPAILNFPDYVASGFNGAGTAAKNILGAGYPPDIVSG